MSQAVLSWSAPDAPDREEIAATLYRNVPTHSRTLLVSLLTRSFVDELLDAVQAGRPADFSRWAEAMAARPGRAQAIEAVLQAAETLPEYLGASLPPGYAEALRSLDHPIREQAAIELEQQAYEYSDRLDEVDSAVGKLVVKLSERNPQAAEHAREVASWCKRLARRLSLSEKATTFVERCGLLHNIGELEVPSHAGGEEVLAGERIVRGSAAALAQFAPVVRAQREALDGSGTPDGLRGEAITLPTRILAVACAFNDAITGRAGHAPLSVRAAVDTLSTGCGSRYDVTVVAALVGLTSGIA
jgi:HD-GYP domain-containing protein (c-di-GMP phosphodiesterase class II)